MCVLLRVTRLMTNVLEMTEEVLQPCYYNTKLADIFNVSMVCISYECKNKYTSVETLEFLYKKTNILRVVIGKH